MFLLFSLPADVAASQEEGGVDVGALFDAHASFLVRQVARLAGSGPHVEDIVQEAFLIAHKKRSELREGPEVRGWLYRVCRNLVQHHRRSIARRIRLERAVKEEGLGAALHAPDETVLSRQHGHKIREALLELPMKQREVMALFELEGLEGNEIAALLDIPVGTVWTRLHHARERFRKAWMSARKEAA